MVVFVLFVCKQGLSPLRSSSCAPYQIIINRESVLLKFQTCRLFAQVVVVVGAKLDYGCLEVASRRVAWRLFEQVATAFTSFVVVVVCRTNPRPHRR